MAATNLFDIKNSDVIRLYNAINNDRSRIEDILSCTSEEELHNLEWFDDYRPFTAITDFERMGTEEPYIKARILFYQFISDNLGAEISASDCNLNNRYNQDCMTGIFWRVDDNNFRNEIAYMKPDYTFNDFDRVGAYNYRNNSKITLIDETRDDKPDLHLLGFGEYYTGVILNFKSIKGNTITSYGSNIHSYVDEDYSERITSSRILNLVSDQWQDGIADGTYVPQSFKQIVNMDSNVSCNFWIFDTEAELDEYLRTGDYSKAINYTDKKDIDESETKKWYMNCDFRRSSKVSDEGSLYEQNYIYFLADNIISKRPVVGYIINYDGIYNVKLKIKNEQAIIEVMESFDGGFSYDEVYYNTFKNPKWSYAKGISTVKRIDGYYYRFNNKTNIPIFGNETDADRYLNDEIDETSAINDPDITKPLPDNKDVSELNDVYAQIALSKTLILDFAALSEVGRTLYNNDNIGDILDGLKLLGETPLNFICDLFILPFDAKPFCSTTSNNTMFYGLYSVQMQHSFDEVNVNNKILTMFSTYIAGLYNDWRDYMQNYYIYLPYVGITALDIQKYMYKNMLCKVQVDVRTGTVKYYLHANNVIVDTFEGSVRVSMPVIGSNNFAATMSKIGAVSNVASSITSVAGTGVSELTKASEGIGKGITSELASLPSTIAGNVKNISELVAAAPKHVSGNFSSQTALFDELNAYLIIDAQEIIYPDNIKTAYNLPDNRYGKIGSCSGYIQADLIKLKSHATESEQAEILSILQNGVIV